jgi:hypothetical protein
MKVQLFIDGHMGLHTKDVDLEEEIVKHATSIDIDGINYTRTCLEFNKDTSEWTAKFYHFVSKEDELRRKQDQLPLMVEQLLEADGWKKIPGGFTEARDSLKKLFKEMEEDEGV